MSKKEEKKELSDREIRWKAFLEKAQAQNPVRFQMQLEAGDFETIPDSFK